MTDYELLSRMLSGELSRAEERDLKTRMKKEPQLAAAWEALHGLPDILAAMPEDEVPPELNAAVLAHRRVRQLSRALRLVPWALAAGVLLLVLGWPDAPSEPTAVLVEGRQIVDGEVMVLAGGVPVSIDGRAEISVEPLDGPLRDGSQEVNDMKLESIAAALVGAVVTVVVYEGSALINPGADAVALAAGETHTVGSPAPPSGPGDRPVTTRTSAEALASASRDELTDRVSELEAELASLTFEQQINRGRLSAHEGSPQEWPDDLPAAFEPEGIKEAVAASMARMEDAELVSIDCDEFPCFVTMESFAEGDDWSGSVELQRNIMTSEMDYEGEVSTSTWAHAHQTNDDIQKYVTFYVAPEDSITEEVSSRTKYRIESAIEDLVAENSVPDEADGE